MTPSQRAPSTPGALRPIQPRTGTRLHSARSVRQSDIDNVRPNSARGILRRLAKVTASTTKRRVITPHSLPREQENIRPQPDSDGEGDVKKPKINFSIEESIGEDDSEVLVAPTPSAVLDDTDDEDEDEDDQPTLTFLRVVQERSPDGTANVRQSCVSALPHSDSAVQEERNDVDSEDGDSTFLTERGRRAVSEEPTRMSRYSFGSIRMSEFGSELEIRRQSDRQQKLAALAADDDYGGGIDLDNDIQLGGETEDLRYLPHSSPRTFAFAAEEESLELPSGGSDGLELSMFNEVDNVNADQRAASGEQPRLAESDASVDGGEINDAEVDNEVQDSATEPAVSTKSSRRQTLLESVTATARARPKKKLKMNQRGNLVPALPCSLIKRIVHDSQEKAGKRKTSLGKEHMQALEQATEWFFEQVSEDVEAYSQHGRRKKRVSEGDVLLLMRRQRLVRQPGELHELAKQWLPREVVNEMDLPERP